MVNLSKLIYPYQNIRALKPYVYRIGITKLVRNRIRYDYSVNNNFKTHFKKKNVNVNSDEILSSIYNLDLEKYYFFYTPYKGKVINVNYKILTNIEYIMDADESANWLFDINVNPNLNLTTYY